MRTHQKLMYAALMKLRPAPIASFVKRAFGLQRIVLATDQGRYWVDPVSVFGQALLREHSYEPELVETFKRHLRPGGTFVDLGANEGYFSVIGAGLVGAGGRGLAIEPQSRLQPVIRENLALNRVGNVKVANVAISDRHGAAKIHLTADTNSGSSGLSKIAKYSLPMQDVEMQTLAGVLDQEMPGRIDFMKVDIEGGEYEAILGSPDVFRQHRVRVLALELHPRQLAARGKDAGELERFLRACGYTSSAAAPSVWIAPEGH